MCRHARSDTWGNPSDTASRRHSVVIELGNSGAPSNLRKTRASSVSFPSPSAKRCSACARRCVLNSTTTDAGSEICRRPYLVFGLLESQPCFGLFKRLLDAEFAAVQIQIPPAQREKFTASHSRRETDHRYQAHRPAAERCQHLFGTDIHLRHPRTLEGPFMSAVWPFAATVGNGRESPIPGIRLSRLPAERRPLIALETVAFSREFGSGRWEIFSQLSPRVICGANPPNSVSLGWHTLDYSRGARSASSSSLVLMSHSRRMGHLEAHAV